MHTVIDGRSDPGSGDFRCVCTFIFFLILSPHHSHSFLPTLSHSAVYSYVFHSQQLHAPDSVLAWSSTARL